MIQCQEVQTWIDQNSDNGVYQTEDVRLHLESCGKCREYRQQLEMLVNTLDRIVIPDPPEGLVDDVMLFLEEHEPEMIEFPEYDWGELLRETRQAFSIFCHRLRFRRWFVRKPSDYSGSCRFCLGDSLLPASKPVRRRNG